MILNKRVISNYITNCNKNKEGIENFARNVLKEQGRNFDTEFNEFMKNFK